MYSTEGDPLTAGKAVQHPSVTHRDSVVDGDGVELLGDRHGRLDLAGDESTYVGRARAQARIR